MHVAARNLEFACIRYSQRTVQMPPAQDTRVPPKREKRQPKAEFEKRIDASG
jgi:hypothetical protein